MDGGSEQMPKLRGKRALDLAAGYALLVLLSPAFAVCAVLVRLSSRGPIFFQQQRIGKAGVPFTIFKFRSMYVDSSQAIHEEVAAAWFKGKSDASGAFKSSNDPRVTRVGRVLRRTSLDEIPQLINVVRGEMSLVGPRPGLAYEREQYEPWYFERDIVPPGITGLWQVSGRERLSASQMMQLDVHYIRNWSLWLDLKILIWTIPAALGRPTKPRREAPLSDLPLDDPDDDPHDDPDDDPASDSAPGPVVPEVAPPRHEPTVWPAHLLDSGRRRARNDQRLVFTYGTLLLGAGAVLLVGLRVAPAQRVVAGLAALAVIALTAWRPGIGCALLALLTPLVGGLGRNVVVPLLRPSEAITGLVVFGALLHQLPDKRRRPLSGLDLVILIYGVVTVVVPAFVVYFGKASTSLDVWRAIIAPLQYVTIYLLFSRLDLDDRWKRRIVKCVMIAGLVVALVGIAQLLNVPGVRSFIGSHYVHTKAAADLCQYGICRPTSLLEHWSSYGAFAAMQFTIALALLTTRAIGFSTKWLSVVLAVNGLAVLASQTQAAVAAVVLATGLVLWYGARVPRQIIYAVFGLAIALALFWPQIQARYDQQIGQRPPAEAVGPVSNVAIPQSMQTRIRLWDEYFLPAVKHHLWWGTGTVLPPEIPDRFAKYIDNEYLRLAFRGGAAAVSAHLLLLAALAKHGARQRLQRQSLRRAVASIALAYALIVALMGISGEYLTFLGISQTFWIMTGLLGGFLLQREPIPLTRFATMALAGQRVSQPVGAVTVAPEKQVHEVAASASGARPLSAIVYRPSGSGPWSPVAGVGGIEETPLVPERLRSRFRAFRAGGLASASALVFVGTSLGRALGFGFLIVAARLLGPSSYGLLAYALAVSNLTIVLVNNAPNALATYLARTSDTHERRRYFSNGMLFVALMVLISLIAILPITLAARLNAWMLIGLGANLLGITAYAIYRESQRGQSRFFPMMAFYVVANFLQLASIVVLDGLGLKTPALFLFVYGSSGIAALIIMQLAKPIGLPFSRQLIHRDQLRIIAAFTWPLCMQAAFWAIWFGSDLFLIQWFLPARVSGHYAAAKTVANVLLLVPVAIGGVLVPHLARLEPARRIHSVVRVLIGTAVLMVPVCLVLVVLRTFLIRAAFGSSYAAASGPVVWLTLAMLIDSGFLVLEATWQAIGRTRVLPVATAAAMVATVSSGVVLVPRLGINGGAIAFAIGAATRFGWIGIFTIRKLSSAAATS